MIFPQPVIRTVNLRCSREIQSPIMLEIFNIFGNRIATIEDFAYIGDNLISCQLNAPTGIYYYNLKASDMLLHGMFHVVR